MKLSICFITQAWDHSQKNKLPVEVGKRKICSIEGEQSVQIMHFLLFLKAWGAIKRKGFLDSWSLGTKHMHIPEWNKTSLKLNLIITTNTWQVTAECKQIITEV